jgi:hypothetical protein
MAILQPACLPLIILTQNAEGNDNQGAASPI